MSFVPTRRLCVFLLQLGGPETLADIEPFLYNLFADVLPVPGWLRPTLARWTARRRAPKVRPLYQEIGGGSPLRRNTEAQAQALEKRLTELGFSARVLVAMRYAPPRAEAALEEARQHWSDALWVALPLYPQYSFATTRSSIEELQGLITNPEHARFVAVNAYPSDDAYLDSMAECVNEALQKFDNRHGVQLLFSAHGLPMRFVKEGDPYPDHIQLTVSGIVERLKASLPHHLAYQSRVGPVRWLGPETMQTVRELGARGVKKLLVVPISFVSEHIETLHELDIQLAAIARAAGIEQFVRAATPGARPSFIDALASVVVHALPRDSIPPGALEPPHHQLTA